MAYLYSDPVCKYKDDSKPYTIHNLRPVDMPLDLENEY